MAAVSQALLHVLRESWRWDQLCKAEGFQVGKQQKDGIFSNILLK